MKSSASNLLVIGCLPIVLFACSSSSDDDDNDSAPNANNTVTQRLVQSTSQGADGSTGSIATEYSEQGHIQRQTFRSDGEVTTVFTFETTDTGQLIRRSQDTDLDGEENFSSLYVYGNGTDLSRVYRVGSNSLIDLVEIFEFEDSLAVSRTTLDVDNVATIDEVDESTGVLVNRRDYTYVNGQLSVNRVDSDGDSEVDLTETYTYNPDGTLATVQLDSAVDGAISTSSFVYEQGPCVPNFANSVTGYFCVGTR